MPTPCPAFRRDKTLMLTVQEFATARDRYTRIITTIFHSLSLGRAFILSTIPWPSPYTWRRKQTQARLPHKVVSAQVHHYENHCQTRRGSPPESQQTRRGLPPESQQTRILRLAPGIPGEDLKHGSLSYTVSSTPAWAKIRC